MRKLLKMTIPSLMEKYKPLMKPGTYFYDVNTHQVIHSNCKPIPMISYSSPLRHYLKKLVVTILGKRFIINKSKGQAVIIKLDYNHELVKVFDYKQAYVIMDFEKTDYKQFFIEANELVKTRYNIPAYHIKDEYVYQTLLSEVVCDYHLKLEYFFTCSTTYFDSLVDMKSLESLTYEDYTYPKVVSHGDFWSRNVLYNGKGFSVIDLDKVTHATPYYDLFMFMYCEWKYNSNKHIILELHRGHYDKWLNDLMRKFDLGPVSKCKLWDLFVYEYSMYRHIDSNKKELDQFKKEIELIKTIG
jgi:hypothetical protein